MAFLARLGFGAYGPHVRQILWYSVIANLMVIAPSIHMLQVYDRVLSARSMSTLIYLTLIVIVVMCVYGIADAVRARVAIRAAAKYSVAVAPKLFAKMAETSESAASSGRYLREYAAARGFIGGRSFITLFDLPFIPVYTAIMFMLHWSIGLLTVFGILVLCFLSWLNIVSTEADRDKSRQADNDAAGFAQSVFIRSEEMRAGGMLPAFLSIWGRKTAIALQEQDVAGGKSATYQAISKSFRQVLQVLMMAWGAFLVLQNEMSAGMIFMSSMMSGKALGPIDQLIGGWEQISKGVAAIRSIEELTGPEKTISARMALPNPKGLVSARALTFTPDPKNPDRKILNAINLDIRPGEAVLITGQTGAGKSTLLRILAGAIAPSSGLVTIDSIEQAKWPASQWGEVVGYVPQDIEFFPGTIAANISRFNPQASQNSIVEAAMKAGAHDVIMKLPDGYRTVVGTANFTLSSGQKQKIALARAVYGNPRVLILDEANANLDQSGEGALLNCIAQARADGAAIILAAHRNSVLRVVDRAFVIKDGALEPMNLNRERPAGMAGSAPPAARPMQAPVETNPAAAEAVIIDRVAS